MTPSLLSLKFNKSKNTQMAGRIKPLNQEIIPMLIVEDLGMTTANDKSTKVSRFALFECPNCLNPFKSRVDGVKDGKTTQCKECKIQSQIKEDPNCKHNMYSTWTSERSRCEQPGNTSYKYYGGRGIKVHEVFQNFRVWLHYIQALPNYGKAGYTLDRVENSANYEPMNLRWVPKAVQAQNTRNHSTNKTGYRGVTTRGDKYLVGISVDNKRIHIGTFSTLLEAATAFNKYVIDNSLHHTLNIIKD